MLDIFETLEAATLETVGGGITQSQIPSAAHWIMEHESGGNTHAKNPTSTAFGAFQMLKGNRKHYMGAQMNSTNFTAQYNAATHYVNDRYHGWSHAEAFWKKHNWY